MRKYKILIIEDEPNLLEMYRIYLEKADYHPITASDGKTGLELAQKEKPDLIILDILLPEINGWMLLKRFKSDPRLKKIPVLIFSNLGQPEEIKKGLQLGGDDYLLKTDLTPKELLEKIKKMLSLSKEKKKKGKRTKLRILIIEDEKELANIYRLRLEKEGYEVEIAHNGAWGLKLAKSGNFDLILMDMVMPVINGYEALQIIKNNPKSKDIPIIVFSNSAQEEEIAKAIELGAVDYFLKSKVTPTEITQEVNRLLKKNK